MFAQPARRRHVLERRPSRDGWRAEQPELLVEAVPSRPDAQQGFDEADFCGSPPNRLRSSTHPRAAPLQRRFKEAEVTVCFVLHRVADYDAWRRAYDRVPDVQRERGVTGQAVYRAEGDPNNLLVMQEFRSSQEAHSFFDKPQFREVMEYAGVDVDSLRLEFYDPA